MVDNIVDYNTLESNAFKINLRSVRAKELFLVMSDAATHLVKNNSNRFILEMDESVEAVYRDPSRLRRSVYNLIKNANKFTNKGLIVLRTNRLENLIYFEVEDEGIRIHKGHVEQIFEAFNQAHDHKVHDLH